MRNWCKLETASDGTLITISAVFHLGRLKLPLKIIKTAININVNIIAQRSKAVVVCIQGGIRMWSHVCRVALLNLGKL